jgi:REP element-mobilizing transposase RayT
MWNLPAPPGFQGLRDDLPITVYEQALPHWRQEGASYFVTFRLADSLPQSRLQELRRFKEEWERRHRSVEFIPREGMMERGRGARGLKSTVREELAREVMQRVEDWLDQGMGSCALRVPEAADAVVAEMQRDDGTLFEVGCRVVMSNHVHAVVRPLEPEFPLENVLKRWKGASAVAINRLRERTGTLWQRESFDRIIRDEEHLWRAIQYIGRNPRKAGLSNAQARLWIRPSWVECGWNFEEDILKGSGRCVD